MVIATQPGGVRGRPWTQGALCLTLRLACALLRQALSPPICKDEDLEARRNFDLASSTQLAYDRDRTPFFLMLNLYCETPAVYSVFWISPLGLSEQFSMTLTIRFFCFVLFFTSAKTLALSSAVPSIHTSQSYFLCFQSKRESDNRRKEWPKKLLHPFMRDFVSVLGVWDHTDGRIHLCYHLIVSSLILADWHQLKQNTVLLICGCHDEFWVLSVGWESSCFLWP